MKKDFTIPLAMGLTSRLNTNKHAISNLDLIGKNTKKTLFMKPLSLLLRMGAFALIIHMVFANAAFGQTVLTITSDQTWVVPLGVTSVKIEAWGGGGGGAIGNVASSVGNGGGGGAFATQVFSVNGGETYFINIGTGGSGNAEITTPSNKNGKSSSFSGPYGTLSASGGIGGTALGGGGNGGTGNYNGGKGGSGASGYSGAGGGGAGNAGSGSNGGTSTAGAGGLGDPNIAPNKGGTGGAGRNTAGVGNVGNIPGGGGSGGKGAFAATNAGGVGARGQVVITFSYDQCYNGTLTLQQGSGAISQTVNQYYPISDIAFDLGGNATGVNVIGLPLGVTGSLNLGVFTISGTSLESGTFDYSLITTGTPSPCLEDEINGTLIVNPEPYNPMAGRIVFNESGTWQVPQMVSSITIKAWGGGGGGGAASNGAGGGGGGGTYSETTIPVTTGDIYDITVGSQGSGGSYTIGSPATSNGNSGNPTIIKDPTSTTILTAPGGSGGGGGLGYISGLSIIQSNGSGGAGGTGDFNGGSGGTANNTSGSGGGGAGNDGNGGDGGTLNPGSGGLGSPNIPPFVGGLGGSQRTNNGEGNAGGLPGAGASGARAWNYGLGYNGGTGARGQVVITFDYDGCLDGTLILSSTSGTDNQSLCYNVPIENIKYTTGGFATGAEADGLPAGLTGNFSAGVFTITGTPTESGTFNYTVTTTGTPDPCTEGTANGTITINPQPAQNGKTSVIFDANGTWQVPAGVSNITVEAWGGGGAGGGVELSFVGIGGGGGGGAYAVKNDIPVTPLASLDIVVASLTSGTPAQKGTDGGHSTITGFENQIYAAGGKGGESSVLLSPYPFGGNSGLALDSQGDCAVNGISGLDGYRVTAVIPVPLPTPVDGAGGAGATSNGGAGGMPVGDLVGPGNNGSAPGGGGSGSRSALTTALNTTGGSGAAGRVIISYTCPIFSLSLTSASGSDDQKVCINTNLADIVYEIGGGATGAEVTGLPTGVTGSVVSNVLTISGASTESGTFNYTVTTTGHVSPCTPDTAYGTIYIEPTPVSGTLTKTPNITNVCHGDNVLAVLTAGSGGNGADSLVYKTQTAGTTWSSWANYTSGSSISTSGKTAVEILTLRKASYCNDAVSYSVSYTVYDAFTSGSIGKTGETICYDHNPAPIGDSIPASGGYASIIYQWQSSDNAAFTGTPTDIGTNAASYDPPTNLTTTTWYRRQAKDETCNTTFTSSAEVWKVTVNPLFDAGNIKKSGETICYSGDPAQIGDSITASGGNASIIYQWQSSTNADFTGTPSDIGSNTASYNPPANLTTTTWYRRQAKDGACNTTFTTSGGVWKVTVRPIFNAGSIKKSGQSICYDGDPALIGDSIPASGGDASISYQWQSSTDVVFALPTNISSNTTSYDPPANLTTTTWYRRQAKDGTCNTTFESSAGVWRVEVPLLPIISGSANVTQSQVVTYSTPYNPGNTYTWNASHGNPELCFPYRNCLTLTWDFPCGIINPGYVRVTETNTATGCSTTVTKWITIAP